MVANFHADAENRKKYSLDIGLVFVLNGTEEMAAALERQGHSIPLVEQYHYMYPVNVGRNVALGQVSKSFMGLFLSFRVHIWFSHLCQCVRTCVLGLLFTAYVHGNFSWLYMCSHMSILPPCCLSEYVSKDVS